MKNDSTKLAVRLDNKKSALGGFDYFTITATPSLITAGPGIPGTTPVPWTDFNQSKLLNSDDVRLTGPILNSSEHTSAIFRFNLPNAIPINAVITEVILAREVRRSGPGSGTLNNQYSIQLDGNFSENYNDYTLNYNFDYVAFTIEQNALTPSIINNGQYYLLLNSLNILSTQSRYDIDQMYLEIEYKVPISVDKNTSWTVGTNEGTFKITNSTDLQSKEHFIIDESGTTQLNGLQISKNAGFGKILTSTENGKAFWAEVPNTDFEALWINKEDTAYYGAGPVQINNNAPNPALIFNKGDSRLNNGINMLETNNRLLNVIVDSDNNQANEQFNIFKDSTQALAQNPTVRFNLGGNDSWINSGNLIIGSDVLPSTSATSDTLMFYDKMKGALRVGRITNSTAWAPSSIGVSSLATGEDNAASGINSFATGRDNSALGDNSFATGVSNLAIGDQSFVAGFSTIANNAYSTAIGLYTDTIGTNITNPTLFTVGNGTSSTNRKNAIVVRLDGYVGLGNMNTPSHPIHHLSGARLTSAGIWTDASDRRLKSFINPIRYGLKEVMQLKPSSYIVNSTGETHVGFIAQELKLVIPEVVNGIEGDIKKGETLGVAYGSMVAVLTKAIQEQQAQIEELKNEIKKLKEK